MTTTIDDIKIEEKKRLVKKIKEYLFENHTHYDLMDEDLSTSYIDSDKLEQFLTKL